MIEHQVHDPDLLDALEAISPQSFEGTVWRVTWATGEPLTGGTGGGRWHPANDFEALYTNREKDGALAEIHHHLSLAPVFSSSHVRLNELRVRTGRALVFDDIAALAQVGVDEDMFRRGDDARTREIGAAARFLDMDGLIVPSARWDCTNLILFPDRLTGPERPALVKSSYVNWPAWREQALP